MALLETLYHMTPRQLVKRLTQLSLPNTFNPYNDRCDVHDKSNAPVIRRGILIKLLERAATSPVDAIWVGRDLGYRGGRRTGMALTDDAHMHHHAARWGVTVQRPTKGKSVNERTADMIWNMLDRIDKPVFLWNVFPLHPHEPTNPFSNRQHTALERDIGEELLTILIELLNPARVIAIGNNAAASADRVFRSGSVELVRHPSYGGHREFVSSMEQLYKLPETI